MQSKLPTWLPTFYLIGSVVYPFHALAQVGEEDNFGQKSQITVFCTSNRDTTGVCIDPITTNPLDCVATPGAVVPCKRSDGIIYQCQWLSSTPLQIELSCSTKSKGEADPISTELFEGESIPPERPASGSGASPGDDAAKGAAAQDEALLEAGQEPMSASEFAETFNPDPTDATSAVVTQESLASDQDPPESLPLQADQRIEIGEEVEASGAEAQRFDDPFLQDFFSRPD